MERQRHEHDLVDGVCAVCGWDGPPSKAGKPARPPLTEDAEKCARRRRAAKAANDGSESRAIKREGGWLRPRSCRYG